MIEVKNRFDVLELEQRASRKELGYGIKNIQRTVENHNGIYKQWIEDETFYTSILFWGV
ncbi:GHKL domain-containing protein [Enterococcus sp. LJL99]